jgi:hypothetical protein
VSRHRCFFLAWARQTYTYSGLGPTHTQHYWAELKPVSAVPQSSKTWNYVTAFQRGLAGFKFPFFNLREIESFEATQKDETFLRVRVARFFSLAQYTKTRENIPNYHNITKWPKMPVKYSE